MKTRAQNVAMINQLWGAPGEPTDTTEGRRIFLQVLREIGLVGLTDETVAKLAATHEAQEAAIGRLAPVYR